MRDAVICEPIRTPVGRYGGVFASVPATDLASTVVRELVARTGITSADIDDALLGQCYPNGEAPAMGRVAVLDAGLDVTVPGLQLDRRCGSGLQAVVDAAMRVQTGICDLVLAGGVESMSRVPIGADGGAWAQDPETNSATAFVPQGIGADLIATLEGFSRADVDAFALESAHDPAREERRFPSIGSTRRCGISSRKRLGGLYCVDPKMVRLQAWLRYSRSRARVMPT